tara:strand:- start:1129 stop:1449 length:321 start_codon:yes stop_codon:yes gene_type:complete
MNPNDHEYRAELRSYMIGLGAALVLTVMPFALVAFLDWSTGAALSMIAVFALVQIVVHLRYFLHIDLGKQKREDLQLILFSTFLLAIMAGGTIWIMANLQMRMMGQ